MWRELHVLAKLVSAGKAGGARGQDAVRAGFLEAKIGGVPLPDPAASMLSKEKCET